MCNQSGRVLRAQINFKKVLFFYDDEMSNEPQDNIVIFPFYERQCDTLKVFVTILRSQIFIGNDI